MDELCDRPNFALTNAVELNGDVLRHASSSSVTLGIVFGLVGGTLVGITAATWLFTRRRLSGLPVTLTWPPLVGVATVAGIGFTVTLLIADISFDGDDLEEAKLGILAASVLASVFDVHEHAALAAEAAEAAGAQGRFWEMHDLLYAHQDALTVDDFLAYARQLGLDEDRFFDDLDSRRFAPRVARDLQSADASGVAGTPTFFINGRRHYGAYDLDSLTAAFRIAQGVRIDEPGTLRRSRAGGQKARRVLVRLGVLQEEVGSLRATLSWASRSDGIGHHRVAVSARSHPAKEAPASKAL